MVDAYSGIGTIALFLSGHTKKVYGLEVVPEAVENARNNAVLNKISDVEFHLGEVEKHLPALAYVTLSNCNEFKFKCEYQKNYCLKITSCFAEVYNRYSLTYANLR